MIYLAPVRNGECVKLKRGLWLFVLLVLGCADVIDAQEQKKIGVLSGGFAESASASTEPRQPRTSVPNLRENLKELGWTESRNVRFEHRYAKGQLRQLPEFARQLVNSKIDVIVAHAPAAVRAAKDATTSIPIVAGVATGFVELGIVPSLARPGGNVTGMELGDLEVFRKETRVSQTNHSMGGSSSRARGSCSSSSRSYPEEYRDGGQLAATAASAGRSQCSRGF